MLASTWVARPKKLAQQIQGVDGLVNQHAAALGLQAARQPLSV